MEDYAIQFHLTTVIGSICQFQGGGGESEFGEEVLHILVYRSEQPSTSIYIQQLR